MFIVCAVYVAVLLGTAHSQCTRIPTENEIQNLLQSIVTSAAGEGSVGAVALLNHHFTCIAPTQKMGEIQQVSIAVVYNFTTYSAVTDTRRQQIQLECRTDNNYRGATTPLEENPPAVAFTLSTRKDCFLCVPSGPAANINVDADANCAGKSCMSDLVLCTCIMPSWHFVLLCVVCPSQCGELAGQDRCYYGPTAQCCSVYENGSCFEMCSTNRTASAATNFICGKQCSYKIHEVHACINDYAYVL